MTAYFLWLKQEGEGCDYMVGCGEKLIPLKAENLADATAEIQYQLEYHSAMEIEKVLLLAPAMNVTCMVEAFKAEANEKKREEELEKAKEAVHSAALKLAKLQGKTVEEPKPPTIKIILPGMNR